MMAVPRSSESAADDEALTPANGTVEPPPDANGHLDGNGSSPGAASSPQQQIVKVNTSIEPVDDAGTSVAPGNGVTEATTALATVGPRLGPDPGLYAVLGLDPSVSDAEIQTTYRRLAARLQGGGGKDQAALRQLNVAYEVLGTRVRRDEYDRLRLAQLLAPVHPARFAPAPRPPPGSHVDVARGMPFSHTMPASPMCSWC